MKHSPQFFVRVRKTWLFLNLQYFHSILRYFANLYKGKLFNYVRIKSRVKSKVGNRVLA